MRIIFLTKYDKLGASSRYRFFQFYDYLKKNKVECITKPFFDDDYLKALYQNKTNVFAILKAYLRRFCVLFTLKKYDLLVIEKEIFPYFPSIFEKLLARAGIKYIADYDDALFHQYDQHSLKAVRYILGQKIANVMKYSNLTIVGNEYLNNYARAAGAKNVVILPTVINIDYYPLVAKLPNFTVTIGWIGSPSTVKYITFLEPVFSKLQTLFDIQIVLIGVTESPFKAVSVNLVPWTEESEFSEINKIDIGIMPLTDSLWERGKCGFKLIQYMGCALPVVASPVGINCKIVTDDINGYLAKTEDEWFNALYKLITNRKKRIMLGRQGRDLVESEYSKQIIAPRLLKLYKDTVCAE